jgi:NarL family two-component system response regulator LiaR
MNMLQNIFRRRLRAFLTIFGITIGVFALVVMGSMAEKINLLVDGAEATRLIRAECPHVQVVALTSYKEEDLVQAALRAGAISYLLKNVSAAELAQAIRAAHAGRPTLAPEAAQVLINAATRSDADEGSDLTDRELEVLRLMVNGLTNPDIATKLFVSRSTVKFHVSNILMKLGATSRTEAVSMALHGKLVD